MLKGLGDVGKIMKLQKELKNIQKRLKMMESVGESGDGMVSAVVDGEHKLISISIDQCLLDKTDKKKLENSIVSAVNSAVDKNKKLAAEEMEKLTGGMNIPGLGNMFE
jgi:nucleoid-associated protein EbfC